MLKLANQLEATTGQKKHGLKRRKDTRPTIKKKKARKRNTRKGK